MLPVFLNGEGDVAFATIHENYVAYDLGSTPEPSSLVLLGTGMLAGLPSGGDCLGMDAL